MPITYATFTARDLSIHYAYLGMLVRTRNEKDSQELKAELDQRIKNLKKGNMPMITDTGTTIFASNNSAMDAWSSHQNYKPVFDMRDAKDQRIDPDLIDDEWDRDV